MKAAIFHPAAIAVIRSFPEAVRRAMGKAIFDLQNGQSLAMPVSKPIPSIAAGAEELRMKDETGAYRAFYFSRSAKGILIFHAFIKKTQATPKREIELGRRRLRELRNEEI